MKILQDDIKKSKLKNVKFIKGFNQITLKNICEEEKLKRNNVYSLKISNENLKRIKENIDRKINKLYEDYNEDSTL